MKMNKKDSVIFSIGPLGQIYVGFIGGTVHIRVQREPDFTSLSHYFFIPCSASPPLPKITKIEKKQKFYFFAFFSPSDMKNCQNQ
jgi:hypothetical protein